MSNSTFQGDESRVDEHEYEVVPMQTLHSSEPETDSTPEKRSLSSDNDETKKAVAEQTSIHSEYEVPTDSAWTFHHRITPLPCKYSFFP